MSLLTRTDVTAVKFFNKYILAGIGSFLEVYHRDTGKFIRKINVLKGQKIYGIKISKCESKLLIFGGKQFSIMELDFNHDGKTVSDRQILSPVVCDDWIHSGVFLAGNNVALLTAHNVVQVWNTETISLTNKYISKDNSILYSGLLLPLEDDILVFSGTVFSEVIIHRCGDDVPLHHLKGHKGVIFSITYNSWKGIIVTTSDDRSVRIWRIDSEQNYDIDTKNYWINAKISCVHNLYGHMARVMRSHITDDFIISIGEDSGICFWSHEGKLLRKILSHQNACIWSLDADDRYLVTGGGDCGVMLHPLSIVSEYGHKEVIPVEINTPKKVKFTARRNILIMNESNQLIYYDSISKTSHVTDLNHTSTFKLLTLSSCKQIIAVADMNGKLDIFVENCKGDAVITRIIDTKLNLGKILSLQWSGNRHLIACSENGRITVLASKEIGIEAIDEFSLPPCKERWLTASALSVERNILIVGDRVGHIYVYRFGNKNPVRKFDKVYDRYGATSITIKNNEFITTGRDGKIKYFFLSNYVSDIKYMSCRDLDFQWLEKFLDKNENYLCGFHERVFVVYDVKNNSKVLEVACGGGHRSWDVVRYIEKVDDNYEEFIEVLYLKNYTLHSEKFQLSKIVSKNIVDGIHSKQINCVKVYKCNENNASTILISGGEDTTLRISKLNRTSKVKDHVIFKQLSSVRTVKIHPLDKNKILLLSAGGRAQICVKIVTFNLENGVEIYTEELIDYLIKGTDKERKGDKNWRNCSIDFDPETRIMDLEILKKDDNFIIVTACSDGALRTFDLDIDKKKVNSIQEIQYYKNCMLKTHIFEYERGTFLIATTSIGDLAIWDFRKSKNIYRAPNLSTRAHKAGINCIDVSVVDSKRFLLATAGDDNEIHLYLMEMKYEINSLRFAKYWTSDKYHCSQIAGIKICGGFMVSTGIDQRVTLFRISVADEDICEFYSQHYSDVSDIHGLDVVDNTDDSLTIIVFGKGMEVLRIPKPAQ